MAKNEKRSFRYKERDNQSMRDRANMRGGNYDSIFLPKFKLFKPRDGKNIVRILPPTWDDAKHYGYDIFVNYGIGADNQSYLSLSKMKNEKDPIAEEKRLAERDGDKEYAKKLNANQRIVYYLIDRNAEEEGIQIWAAPFGFDKDLANICFDEDTGEVVFPDDPENGCDFRFYREGTGIKTSYEASKMKLLKPSRLHDDEKVEDEWLEYINENPIPSTLQFYSYNHIKAVLGGQGATDDDEDDDRPTKGSSRTRTRRDADEEDEKPKGRTRERVKNEDDGDKPVTRKRQAPEEDEPEDKPVGRSRARSRAEPEDEEVEEKPKTRSRREPEDEDDEDRPAKKTTSRERTRVEEPEDEETDAEDEDSEDEDKPDPNRGGSLRDRIKARRQSRDD